MKYLGYPKGCIVNAISPKEDPIKRYLLRVSIEGFSAKDNATVIMMNPSKATEICSDQTVNKVLNFFKTYQDKQVKEITILNLFPYYITDSGQLATHVKNNESSDLANNLNEFKKCIDESDLIILAWGDVQKKLVLAYIISTLKKSSI